MDYLPLFLRIENRRAVVIGGGPVAARKAELLLKCGARVVLIAPQLQRSARELLAAWPGRLEHQEAAFTAAHLEGATLAIAACDVPAVNAQVAREAEAHGIPVNVVDDPARSSFIFPAIVDRSPVIVAIGSQGAAPVLARRLRGLIEALLPARLGELARFAGERRQLVQQQLAPRARRPFWERLFSGPLARQVLAGETEGVREGFARALAGAHAQASAPGEVYLIGAGPGDPDLLTLRALQLLQQADVVLYDRLVDPAVLERARRDAERVFVGKAPEGCHTPQELINELLIDYARRGLKVARLKGGDPFIFGRGGEELQALARAGIACTVVPGITAGLAAAAAAGLPLTHRELSQSVTFVTGHAIGEDALDWPALARPRQTIVFYMSVSRLADIVIRLRAAGAPAQRPAALIERASLAGQRILRSTLAELPALAAAAQVSAPALLVIGEVVGLARAEGELAPLACLLQGVA